VFQKADYQLCILIAVSAALIGCHKPPEDSVAKQIKAETSAKVASEQAKSLTQVAGQATVPVEKAEPVLKNTMPQNAQPYIGRYQITISCKDPFVKCDQGTSDFVINLLADGTAHRTLIHLGQITFDSNFHYQQDRWSYDAQHHQVILHRSNGVEFFYDIDKDENLVMDLDKIAHASALNQQYFAEGNPFPQQAYRLLKEKLS
jgi:hypothetical protein